MVNWTFGKQKPYSEEHLQKDDKARLIKEVVNWNPLPALLPRPQRVQPSRN